MKCFSVHMKLGVFEGITLLGPKRNYFLVGSLNPADERACVGIPVLGLPRASQGIEKLYYADIRSGAQWSKYSFGGIPFPLPKKHACCKAGSDERSLTKRALVMIGTFIGSRFDVILSNGSWYALGDPIGAALKNLYPISIQLARGYRLAQPRNVEQRLIQMDRGSKILIRSYRSVSLLEWDGTSLSLNHRINQYDILFKT